MVCWMRRLLPLVLLGLSARLALALDPRDVPADAPADSIMAGPAEVAQMAEWAAAAFMARRPQPSPADRPKIQLRHQDHSVLRFGKSTLDGPICIGQRTFRHGLGTHANSEIAVSLPPSVTHFKAAVGVDDNPDTRSAMKSTVQFVVEIGGKEVLRTATLRCGDAPLAVDIKIPQGTTEIILKTDATADGTGWDQADWADAQVVAADGHVWWLDEGQRTGSLLTSAVPPFSFVYGSKSSAELLKNWRHTASSKEMPDRTRHDCTWTDPRSGLRVAAELAVYKRYPAADWVLRFENTGNRDTPILEDIQALDVALATGAVRQPAVLHHLAGDDCSGRSFQPLESQLPAGGAIRLAPEGGRSSNGTFPFFNLEYQDCGLFTAIGWTGQWAASLQRAADGPTRLRGGMERTHLLLHPGEAIRSPRILLMTWQGDRMAAHNRFRRLMLFHYTPRQQSRPVAMPTFWQCYDRYNGHPTWPTEAGQSHSAELAARIGFDFLWLDAAWFPGDFPNGLGNWFCKPKAFPHGLKAVSDVCHKLGLRFIVWFEPERVAAGTQIAREHPEFVFGGAGGGLFKLCDPAARQWLTDLLIKRIREYGMDWYRNDFNMDPLASWRQNEAPDRQGITEIRYVEGLYALWDAINASQPGMCIDNCASGGRRIDMEMQQRSVPLWRSDTGCSPEHSDWHQAQAIGMNYFLPLHQICVWTPTAYDVRSGSAAGAIFQLAYLDSGFSLQAAKDALAEVKQNQKYFYGDFYPLTACSADPQGFVAYQVHRPDLDAGLVLAFRRSKCNVLGIEASLGGLNLQRNYEVEFVDEHRQKTTKRMSGNALSDGLQLIIPQRGASLLVRYHPVRAPE